MIYSQRFNLLILCMGTLCTFFFGCSKQEVPRVLPVGQEAESITQEKVKDPSAKVDIKFSKVSLISQEGIDVELEADRFQAKWSEYTPFLVESSPIEMADSYTIVGWDKQNQPHVIQVSNEGIKVGQDYYQVKKTEDLMAWIREHIGLKYLNHVEMERIMVEARDLEIKKELPNALAEDVFQLIKGSSLVRGTPRLVEALYPAYILDIEHKKDHFLQLTVLSPTLISIQDGQDRWYYQLNHSIFSLLKEVIPITYYSKEHIKHLFQAEDLKVLKEGERYSFSDSAQEALTLDTFIHHYVRQFAKGRKTAAALEQEPLPYRVQFIFADSSVKELLVGEHVYYYEGERYELYQAASKVEEIIATIQSHNKQKK